MKTKANETEMSEYALACNAEELPRLRSELRLWERRAKRWDLSSAFHALLGVCGFCLTVVILLSMFATDPLLAQEPAPINLYALGIGLAVIIHSVWMVFVQIPRYKALPVSVYYKTLHAIRAVEKGEFWATAAVEFNREHSESEFLGARID